MTALWSAPFAYPLLPPPGTTVRESTALPPDVQAEVDAQLDAINEARARAAVSAQGYVVWH